MSPTFILRLFKIEIVFLFPRNETINQYTQTNKLYRCVMQCAYLILSSIIQCFARISITIQPSNIHVSLDAVTPLTLYHFRYRLVLNFKCQMLVRTI